MGYSYSVSKPRQARSFTIQGNDGKLKLRHQIEFLVEVTATGGSSLANLSELEVVTASGLPIVNYSVYVYNGYFIPYLLCTSKKAEQNAQRAAQWKVVCSYDSDSLKGNEADQQLEPFALPEDVTPRVEVSSEVLEEVVLVDRSGTALKTPARSLFQEPFYKPLSIVVLTITQYETGWTDDNIAAREHHTNSDIWRSDPAWRWKITSVSATPTAVNGVACHQVKYVTKLHPNATGWKESRALIDTHYLVNNGGAASTWPRRPFLSNGQPTTGYIETDGTKRASGASFLFEDYEILDVIAYQTFLNRVPGA